MHSITVNAHLLAGTRATGNRLRASQTLVVSIQHGGNSIHLHLPGDAAEAAEVAMELIDALHAVRNLALRAVAGGSTSLAEREARRALDEGLDAPEHNHHEENGPPLMGCPRCEYDAILGERHDEARSRDV